MEGRRDIKSRENKYAYIWKHVAKEAVQLLYPSRCPICGKLEDGICKSCMTQLKTVKQPCCCQCGKPVGMQEQEYCPDCRKAHHQYSQGCAMLLYEGKVKEAIYRIKYDNKREYLDTFAKLLAEYGRKRIQIWQPEVLIPIPMYPKQKRERGYNQAEILAKHLGEYWELPVDTDILKKIKDTGAQKELDRAMRRKNLTGAFAAVSEKKYQKVLLVDDVYTTGSTMDAAALALKKAGIAKIFFTAICIGHGDMLY